MSSSRPRPRLGMLSSRKLRCFSIGPKRGLNYKHQDMEVGKTSLPDEQEWTLTPLRGQGAETQRPEAAFQIRV